MTTDVLYNQDCLAGLRTIPFESIDCVVTDCPYKICAGGVTIEERADEMGGVMRKRPDSRHVSLSGVLNDKQVVRSNSKIGDKWVKADLTAIPSAVRNGKMFSHNDIAFSEWLPDVYRVLKKGTHCYIMVNARNLKELQTEAEEAGFVFQNLLVWDKGTATPNKYYMQGLEFILMLSKRPARNINDMGSKNLLSTPNIIGTKRHPCEKPVSLMAEMIRNSTNEGDIVLDPFAGAGSTLIAAKRLNRRYIGFEIDPQYYDIAYRRLYKEPQQTTMFN